MGWPCMFGCAAGATRGICWVVPMPAPAAFTAALLAERSLPQLVQKFRESGISCPQRMQNMLVTILVGYRASLVYYVSEIRDGQVAQPKRIFSVLEWARAGCEVRCA